MPEVQSETILDKSVTVKWDNLRVNVIPNIWKNKFSKILRKILIKNFLLKHKDYLAVSNKKWFSQHFTFNGIVFC